ncbi:MAG: acyltransferase family protein [Candidatus Binatia bacterium]
MTQPATIRLGWIDVVKGMSILWVAFFHAFSMRSGFPWPLKSGYFAQYRQLCAPATSWDEVRCTLEAAAAGLVQFGFHAVAVFIVLSGFGLTYSLAKTGEPPGGWLGWYKSRLLRLFPMYWLAHVVYLVSPFQARPEAIDYRFVLSFFGDRIYPIDMIFYYFNPALWYFGLLLELYLVFPILFRALQKSGVGVFLALSAFATFGCRYLLLCVTPVDGNWVQGAFFVCRLWEFAFGMALGVLYRRSPRSVDRWLFSWTALGGSLILYWLGVRSYAALWSYTFTDALTGTALTIVLAQLALGAEKLPPLAKTLAAVGASSYGLYLLHQPYVLYFGKLWEPLPTPAYVAASGALIAVLAIVCMQIERVVNRLAQRLLG